MSSTGDNTNTTSESSFTKIPSSVDPDPALSSDAEITELGRKFTVALEGRTYSCKLCKTHLALADDIISRAFHCQSGKAYLFSNAENITVGTREERMFISGKHTVADIYCSSRRQILGWKYIGVDHESQKYKEGKFVLERAKILDGLDSKFDMNTVPSMSTAEDA